MCELGRVRDFSCGFKTAANFPCCLQLNAPAGFTEILTWALCSRQENFEALRREDDGSTAVAIGNPATAEFEVCRTSLLPGALKTLGEDGYGWCSGVERHGSSRKALKGS